MALKKPLVLASGQIQELQSGDDIDPQVRVSATDTIPNYLEDKIVAGSNITITKNNAGADETLTIAATGGGATETIHPFLLMVYLL
jgi:hypothetical protein